MRGGTRFTSHRDPPCPICPSEPTHPSQAAWTWRTWSSALPGGKLATLPPLWLPLVLGEGWHLPVEPDPATPPGFPPRLRVSDEPAPGSSEDRLNAPDSHSGRAPRHTSRLYPPKVHRFPHCFPLAMIIVCEDTDDANCHFAASLIQDDAVLIRSTASKEKKPPLAF